MGLQLHAKPGSSGNPGWYSDMSLPASFRAGLPFHRPNTQQHQNVSASRKARFLHRSETFLMLALLSPALFAAEVYAPAAIAVVWCSSAGDGDGDGGGDNFM